MAEGEGILLLRGRWRWSRNSFLFSLMDLLSTVDETSLSSSSSLSSARLLGTGTFSLLLLLEVWLTVIALYSADTVCLVLVARLLGLSFPGKDQGSSHLIDV